MANTSVWSRSLALGLGTGQLRDSKKCRRTVNRALNLGCRHIDTARHYGNEAGVGAAVRDADVERDEVFLATKVHSEDLGQDDLMDSVEKSRDALDVDTIDLVYVHWPAHTYDLQETLGALARVRNCRKIRHIGLSNFTPELLEAAVEQSEAPIYAVQVELHPFLPQRKLMERARDLGLRVVAHTPLCQGHVLDHPVISSIAAKHDVTEAQVSLAWILRMERVAAVPGSRGGHLEENMQSLSVSLDEDDLRRIEAIEERRRCVSYDFAPWAKGEHTEL